MNIKKLYKLCAILAALVLSISGCGNMNDSTGSSRKDSGKNNNSQQEYLHETSGTSEIQPDNGYDENVTKHEEPQNLTDTLTVHFLDVGQGDCTLITCGDKAMLIDAGDNDKGTTVELYLKKQGIKKLDYVIGTHPDADHIGGLDVAIYKFQCDTIILPDFEKTTKTYRDVIDTVNNKNYKITRPVPGDTYSLGQAKFTIVAPSGNDYGDSANNYSVGIRLEYGETSFLLTGDAEEESEEDMQKSGMELKADVYKAAHHGSRTSNSEKFMEAVDPEYAVISCGEDNSYGHPHAQTLNTFRKMGIKVFRTDEQGAIIIKSDGKQLTFNCSPSESWKTGDR